MAKRIKNLKDKINTNGFDKNPENINKNGRKPSIKKELEKIALMDGIMTLPRSQVISIDNKEVKIKLPKQDALALKLFSWAMSKKGNDSIKAIQMIMEQFDGKPSQEVKTDGKVAVTVNRVVPEA